MIQMTPSSGAIVKETVPKNKKEKLQQACHEFESLFIRYLFKSMRSTVTESGFLGQSDESRMIRSMFDEKLADRIAEGRGIGLARVLFEKLEDKAITIEDSLQQATGNLRP